MRVPQPLLNCLAFTICATFAFGQTADVIGEPILGRMVVLGVDMVPSSPDSHGLELAVLGIDTVPPSPGPRELELARLLVELDRLILIDDGETARRAQPIKLTEPVLGEIVLLAANNEGDAYDLVTNPLTFPNDETLNSAVSDASALPQLADVPIPLIRDAIPAPFQTSSTVNRDQVLLRVRFVEMNSTALAEVGSEFYSPEMSRDLVAKGRAASGIIETKETNELVNLLCKRGVAKIIAEPSATVLDGRTARFLTDALSEKAVNEKHPLQTRYPFNWGGRRFREITSDGREFSLLTTPRLLADGRIQVSLICEILNTMKSSVDIVFGQAALKRIETVAEIRPDQTMYLIGTAQQNGTQTDALKTTSSVMILVTAELVRPMIESIPTNQFTRIQPDTQVGISFVSPQADRQKCWSPAEAIPTATHNVNVSDSCSEPAPNPQISFVPKPIAAQTTNPTLYQFGAKQIPLVNNGRPYSITRDTVNQSIAKGVSPASGVVHPNQIEFHLTEVARHLHAAGLPIEAQKIQALQQQIIRERSNQLMLAFKEAQLATLQAEIASLKHSSKTDAPADQSSWRRGLGETVVEYTANDYDIAIVGQGYFQLLMPNGDYRYTRDGSFRMNSTGHLVSADGYPLQPFICIPIDTLSATIGNDGTVSVVQEGSPTTAVVVGNLSLKRFADAGGLSPEGEDLFAETAASGPPLEGPPGTNGFGTLQQGSLEVSTERVFEDLSRLIMSLRKIELRFLGHQSRIEQMIPQLPPLKATATNPVGRKVTTVIEARAISDK